MWYTQFQLLFEGFYVLKEVRKNQVDPSYGFGSTSENLNIVVVGMTLIWMLAQPWPHSLSVLLTFHMDVCDQSVLKQSHLLQDVRFSGFVV